MEIKYFDPRFQEFVATRDRSTESKIMRGLLLLEKAGYELRMPHAKKISRWIYELRIHGSQEIRVFYTLHEHFIYILHAYQKKTDRLDPIELAIAERRRVLLVCP